jgi:hypothetical protein
MHDAGEDLVEAVALRGAVHVDTRVGAKRRSEEGQPDDVSSTVAWYGLVNRLAASSAQNRAVTASPYSRSPVPRSNTIGWCPGASIDTQEVLPP